MAERKPIGRLQVARRLARLIEDVTSGADREVLAKKLRILEQDIAEGIPRCATKPAKAEAPSDDVKAVFEFWRERCGRGDRTKLTPKRRRKIEARLREYPIDDIKRAIANVADDPFHRGRNDRGRQYLELEMILREGTDLERYRDMARAPVGGPWLGTLAGGDHAEQNDYAQQAKKDAANLFA